MFAKSEIETKLDAEIQSALDELGQHEKTSEAYGAIVEHLSKLYKLKTEDRPKPIVNPDTVLVVVANIFGILWLTRYERDHVINSKALGFVKRL